MQMNANDSKHYKEFAIRLLGDGESLDNIMLYLRLSVCIGG